MVSLQVLVVIGRITGFLSVIGSSLIIYLVLADRERKLSRPYHRMMLMMSVYDVLQSLAICFSVTAIPRQSGIYGAKGNEVTCTIQGVFVLLGLAVPLYNSCLNLYYLLTIRYNISSERFSKYEYGFHAITILLLTFLVAISTIYDSFKSRGVLCSPKGKVSQLAYSLILSGSFLICIASMICICFTVLIQANKTRKYTSFKTNTNTSNRESRLEKDKRKTIKQACLYTLAFLFTYSIPLCMSMNENMGNDPPDSLRVLSAILYPLQGFWNFLFYIRPGVQRVMKSNPEKSFIGAMRDILFRHSSVQGDNAQLLSARRMPANTSPSITKKKSVAIPHVANSMASYTSSKDLCTGSSGDRCTSPNEIQISCPIDSSVAKIIDTSGDKYLVRPCSLLAVMEDDVENQSQISDKSSTSAKVHLSSRRKSLSDMASALKRPTSQVTDSPEVNIMEDDDENQSQFPCKSSTSARVHVSSRRMSLPDIASILDGDNL